MRVGHSVFLVLNKMFPISLHDIKIYLDKCNVSPYAKQVRLPFSLSSIQSNFFLNLVHVYVWGPYKTPTFADNKFS